MNIFSNKIINIKKNILILISVFIGQLFFSEGSKDLYPVDAVGNRAFLSSMACSNCAYNPFSTLGRTMVYAKAGEKIHMGSSVQGVENGRIRAFSPKGKRYESSNNNAGKIETRAQELLGPSLGEVTSGYKPFSRTVEADEEGIWVIEFIPRAGVNATITPGSGTSSITNVITATAIEKWESLTYNSNNSAFIAAWDVTVESTSGKAQLGRVFTNVFAGSMGNAEGFYGKFYVMTKDGFSYLIDNNGNNGLSFNSFVNNKGTKYVNGKGTSVTATSASVYRTSLWDPRKFDQDNTNITHKMFYNKPSYDLPKEANIWWSAGNQSDEQVRLAEWTEVGIMKTMWLKLVRENPKLDEIRFEGVEGTSNTAGKKGGYFIFKSHVIGSTSISIPIPGSTSKVNLKGDVSVGENKIYWDGKDDKGLYILDSGFSATNVEISVSGAEVHFPFLDVENNAYGVKIQLLDNDFNLYSPTRDLVYWDLGVTSNTGGLSVPNAMYDNSSLGLSSTSSTSSLKWGSYGNSSNNFGDSRAVVMWSNVKATNTVNEGPVIVYRISDLQIPAMSKIAGPEVPYKGVSLKYSVDVANVGNLANVGSFAPTFMFYVPKGVEIMPSAVSLSSNTGVIYNGFAEIVEMPGKDLLAYKVKLDMPADSQARFIIPIYVTSNILVDRINAWGTIMRGNDTTDPNATNPNLSILPVDPFQEAHGLQKAVSVLDLNSNILSNLDFSNLRNSINNILNPSNVNYTNNIRYVSNLVFNTTASTNCVKSGAIGTPKSYTDIGVLTKEKVTQKNEKITWPENVPNGYLALDSDNKGMVINHMTTEQRDKLTPVKGMIIYNIDDKCVQLYRGNDPTIDNARTGWNCIVKTCNE